MGAPDSINDLLDNSDTASDLSNTLAESMAKGGFNTSTTKNPKTGEIEVRIGDYKKPSATKESSTELPTASTETKLEDVSEHDFTGVPDWRLRDWATAPESKLGKKSIKELENREKQKKHESFTKAMKAAEPPKFAESVDPSALIDKAVAPEALVSGLEKQTPEMRAENGAKFGAQIGLKNGGHTGALIGAAIGSYAARGMGQVKSGEHDEAMQYEKFGEALNTMKIVDGKGNVNFSDGTSVPLPQGKLDNLRAGADGKKTRMPYEYDKTNPFTNRTTTVAKPIALFIANNVVKAKSPKTLEQITATICNTLQTGAKDIDTIYKRAADMASKLGVKPEQMSSFIQSLNLPESQAKDIKKGLEILYAGY